MTLSPAEVSALLDNLNDAGYSVSSYSGRAMYGKRCVGVKLDRSQDPFELGIQMGIYLGEEAKKLGYRTDSMGMGSVVYFPDLAWPEGWTDGTEDDEDLDIEADELWNPRSSYPLPSKT
jgi:hypothetical protein